MKKKGIFLLAGVLVLGILASALQTHLKVQTYKLASSKITSPVRLAVITDLHSTIYGENQEKLVALLEAQEPDAVLLSGDIADDEVPHDGTKQLLYAIGDTYPCFYVSGNHEHWSGEYEEIAEMISSYGVTVLEGETTELDVNGNEIQIAGVNDPDKFSDFSEWESQLEQVKEERNDDDFTILLSHRPELVQWYEESGFDLVAAGHAHGGQIRIPFILNGLFAPNQGWFPDYAGGMYPLGETTMVVSRGLCKNNLPRIWNPPEVVMVELVPDEA